MKMNEKIHALVRQRQCEACGAGAGQYCRGLDEPNQHFNHPQRYEAAALMVREQSLLFGAMASLDSGFSSTSELAHQSSLLSDMALLLSRAATNQLTPAQWNKG